MASGFVTARPSPQIEQPCPRTAVTKAARMRERIIIAICTLFRDFQEFDAEIMMLMCQRADSFLTFALFLVPQNFWLAINLC
jgi:hypothetical protein